MTEKDRYQNTIFFPIGAPNDAYAKFFVGQSYLSPDSWFSHLAIEVPGEDTSAEWLEAVSEEDYSKLA